MTAHISQTPHPKPVLPYPGCEQGEQGFHWALSQPGKAFLRQDSVLCLEAGRGTVKNGGKLAVGIDALGDQ